ncbi:sugar ABC transporter ATP-binding protein [Haloarcula hispanica N601]|uniref:ABC-type D-xylose/L-arabinose transporter n=3 Tax=Haloarcula hispanica TaxID=51589 RepID=V5TSZ7_HALHI|nr:sn-glycerol-3-phosphate ABC transporter ATP-binding protein UgpC [Haloarcula hispanica]AEM59013.1 sugar ABC transporter ATP-binding protein [Haloarcula hispanica ATCC 33960]AHB67709.1 sugar ABC transporter ATP-binding protein [Haloarcula hispanica N601]KAA9404857.1 sn-glycerol-3-phosphate ABC transporter ATP-binding protein UgpC [Haloarcula hispanica]
MAQLELDNLVKTFSDGSDEVVAVDTVNMSLNDGEFLVLVGPSGCGKSTTLRMVAGLETVTEGDILIGDESVIGTEPRDRDIAMVFQNYALYPHMTAEENMSFGLKMTTDLDTETIEQRVTETAEMMGIEDLLDDPPKELSGGQQQRVALGRAIVRDPAVFLMDEPLSNLDAKLRTKMRTELKSLQNELDVTTIYVTHDQTEAMTMGDRIAILDDGVLQQVGTPLECYHRPANRFVAGFIGSPSMNFIPAAVEDGSLVHQEFTYELSAETAAQLDGYEEVILGVRPEDIQLNTATGPEQTVTATVDVVEPLGDLFHVYVTIDGQQYTVTVEDGANLGNGVTVGLRFPEEVIHLFDADSGTAIKNSETEIDEENPVAA